VVEEIDNQNYAGVGLLDSEHEGITILRNVRHCLPVDKA
jgi:hypothetical protein